MTRTSMTNALAHLRIITKKELRDLVPYTGQHIQRLENAGKFPKRIKLGENRVGWLLTEVEAWILQRMAERDAHPAANNGGQA